MRLKVGDTRVAVSADIKLDGGKKDNKMRRGMLYDMQSHKDNDGDKAYTTRQVEKRIEEANNLYNAFFRADDIKTLKSHFLDIVETVYNNLNVKNISVKDLKDILCKHESYAHLSKDGQPKFAYVKWFSYNPVGKDIRWLMKNYVHEYMHKCWYEKEALEAAVQILLCICDGANYEKKIAAFVKREDIESLLSAFIEAVKKCEGKPFIYGTAKLESLFEALVVQIRDACDDEGRNAYREADEIGISTVIERQIDAIKEIECLSIKKNKSENENVFLSTPKGTFVYKCKYVEDERLDAILIRMRQTLKRGTNRDIAIALLKGLASGNFSTAVDDLITNKEKELVHFIDSVNKDYYKFSLIKSVKNMDVKAQVYKNNENEYKDVQETKDIEGASVSRDSIYRLSISNSVKNKGLIYTMERYTSSQESSDAMLIEIKKLLYDYFMPTYNCDSDKIFKAEKVWKFPKVKDVYFDKGFVCQRDADKEREEAQKEIKDIWEEGEIDKYGRIRIKNQSLLKKRIGYVNVGRYIALTASKETLIQSQETALSTEDKEKEVKDAIKKYWVAYVKDYVEKHYVNVKTSIDEKECLASSMLLSCWQSIIRFLCGKFIDIGKMVYHVAMPDDMSIKPSKDGGTGYGIVQPEYIDGISSFIYEDISAEDNLQRSIAGATVAAVNNFARAAFNDKDEDCLLLKEDAIKNCMKKNAVKRVLRFYGGTSLFSEDKDSQGNTTYQNFMMEETSFVNELVRLLAIIRNENFHYTPGRKKCENVKYTYVLLKSDMDRYRELVKKRYYTNNVADFYDKEKIRELVESLYKHTDVGEAQIPAFHSAWKTVDLPKDFIEIVKSIAIKEIKSNKPDNEATKEEIKEAVKTAINSWENVLGNDAKKKKHLGALYFLLKEIYYRDFILDKDNKTLNKFISVLNSEYENIKQMKKEKNFKLLQELDINAYAESNFKSYIDDHNEEFSTFGSLCQKVMNQYGVQNTNREEEKYKHFKMLLLKYTKLAFIEHLKEKYAWLFTYHQQENATVEAKDDNNNYLDDVSSENISVPFTDIIGDKEKYEDASVDKIYEVYKMAWYTLGHYIHPRQLNLLIGECKNYIQYKNDITKRAERAGQSIGESEKAKNENRLKKVSDIIGILDFVKNVTGGVTGCISDYYDETIEQGSDTNQGREEYAKYLSNYIAYAKDGTASFDEFKKFCFNEDKTVRFDMYADSENPKILHNIEFARMYAGGEIPLLNTDEENRKFKITEKDIKTCISNSEEVAKILNKGRCENIDDQKKVVEYQQLKGRITLNDVTNIYEIVSELLGKLVSLSYLRERDQMYLLLGFYYVMLQGENTWEQECEFNAGYIDNNTDNKLEITCGLVLHQVIGIFDFGSRFVSCKEKDNEYILEEKDDGIKLSDKLTMFYSNHKSSYLCAIRLFHDDHNHDKGISNLRNYVDHLHYYVARDKSIVELYSDYYTKAFGYSTRLRQSVINNFTNILDSYFIEVVPKIQPVKNPAPNMPKIELVLSNKFESKKHDYKLKDGKKVQLPAKSEQFVKMLRAVLEYRRK